MSSLPRPPVGELPGRGCAPAQGRRGKNTWTPFDLASAWVAWWAKQVNTPTWWLESIAVPHQGDVCGFARRLWASFQMHKECYHATKGHNYYTAPPAPHCIGQDAYLPLKDMRFGVQDYHLCQAQKTLAYAKALQHWVEEARPPMLGKLCQLAECVHEL